MYTQQRFVTFHVYTYTWVIAVLTYVTLKQGQVYLVEAPPGGISRMYFRSGQRLATDNTHVFPRGKDGGVILGGCRIDRTWDDRFDPEIGESIKRRCCALVPELGKPEDLKIIKQGVGFRRRSSSLFATRRIRG